MVYNSLVSVLMPAFNAEKFISKSIESVLNQTYSNLQLIIYNDGSTDSTKDIILAFQKQDSRILYLEGLINKGLTAGRNELLNASNTEIIAWLDADDIAVKSRLEKQIRYLDKNIHIKGVSCWANIIDENGNYSNGTMKPFLVNNHLRPISLFVNYFVVSGMTMFKNIIPKEGFNPEFSPAEDFDLFARILLNSKLAIFQEVLVDYRVHSGNLTATQSDKMEKAVLGIHKWQLQKLGVDIDINTSKLHYNLSFNLGVSLKEAEKWLLEIKKLNKLNRVYELKSLDYVLAHRWMKVCETNKYSIKSCIASALFKFNWHTFFLIFKMMFKP